MSRREEFDRLSVSDFARESTPIDVTHPSYGADSSGTEDSTAAIQSAVTDAGDAGGDTVYIPNGDYNISSEIILRSDVSIVGDGKYASTIHQTDPSQAVIVMGEGERRENNRIAHVGLTHDYGLGEQDSGQGIFTTQSHVENCLIEHCYIHETSRQAIALWGSSNKNVQVRNNHLRAIVRDGIFVFGEGLQATGNYIDGTGDDAIAFNTDHTTDCIIGNNIIIDGAGVGEMSGGAIKIHGRNTNVIGNVVINANSYGIRAHRSLGDTDDNVPNRNRIHGNILYGIRNAPEGPPLGVGIETRESRSIAISNNSLYNMDGHVAIRIRNVNNASPENNSVINGNFVLGADEAIIVGNDHSYVNINSNTFVDVNRMVSVNGDVNQFDVTNNSARRISNYPIEFSNFTGTLFAMGNNVWTGSYNNLIDGQNSGSVIHDYMNRPYGATTQSFIDDANVYNIIRFSDLSTDLTSI